MVFGVFLGDPGNANAQATDIAICGSVNGWIYYNYDGFVSKDESGWTKDGIPNGKFVIKLLNDGEFDVLSYDSSGSMFSLVQDGGTLVPIEFGSTQLTLLHVSRLKVIEIYSVLRETDGTAKLILVQHKGGGSPIKKSGVMIGNCSLFAIP